MDDCRAGNPSRRGHREFTAGGAVFQALGRGAGHLMRARWCTAPAGDYHRSTTPAATRISFVLPRTSRGEARPSMELGDPRWVPHPARPSGPGRALLLSRVARVRGRIERDTRPRPASLTNRCSGDASSLVHRACRDSPDSTTPAATRISFVLPRTSRGKARPPMEFGDPRWVPNPPQPASLANRCSGRRVRQRPIA
jgi:hypothetical protein